MKNLIAYQHGTEKKSYQKNSAFSKIYSIGSQLTNLAKYSSIFPINLSSILMKGQKPYPLQKRVIKLIILEKLEYLRQGHPIFQWLKRQKKPQN